MQLETTLSTLRGMGFHSPYLLVMNKSECVKDTSIFPFESICISAKENIGIDVLKKRILENFQDELLVCELFIPYEKFDEYAKLGDYIYEKSTKFTDDGKMVVGHVRKEYAQLFNVFIK